MNKVNKKRFLSSNKIKKRWFLKAIQMIQKRKKEPKYMPARPRFASL